MDTLKFPSKESTQYLVSTEASRMFLNREEPDSELCFRGISPPLVEKRIGEKSGQRESYQDILPMRAQR